MSRTALSPRLQAILDALPLKEVLRALEVGCGPGALARAMDARVAPGHVLGIDRSGRAIAQALAASQDAIVAGGLAFRQVGAEDFALVLGEARFDLNRRGARRRVRRSPSRGARAGLAPHGYRARARRAVRRRRCAVRDQ